MSIDEMYAHYIEVENQNALNNFLQNATEKDSFSYPYSKK